MSNKASLFIIAIVVAGAVGAGLYFNSQINKIRAKADSVVPTSSSQISKPGESNESKILSVQGSTPLTLSFSDSKLSGSISDASAIAKGIASFDPNDFNTVSGAVSIDYANGQSASSFSKGFLTADDWNNFNSRITRDELSAASHSALTLDTANGLSLVGQALSLDLASALTSGAVSSVDWTTFNGKESALTFSTGLTRTVNAITSNISTGVTSGQAIYGGTGASDALTIDSTTNATKGNIILNPTSGNVGIGTTSPSQKLNVIGNILASGTMVGSNLTGTNTGDDTSFYIQDNLYYKTTFTSGQFVSWLNGLNQANADYKASDYISVIPLKKYTLSSTYSDASTFYSLYDINKTFISGVQSYGTNVITMPANAMFIRVTFANVENNNNFSLKRQFKFSTMGDSITFQNKWQPQVSTQLSLVPVNFGVSGTPISGSAATSMNNDARINAIDSDSDIVTVLGGTLDWANNVSLGSQSSVNIQEFYGALNITIRKLRARFPNSSIVMLTTTYGELPNSSFTDTTGVLNNLGLSTNDYANAVYNAAINNGVRVIRLDNLWQHDNITQYIDFDGGYLHPNTAGGLLMAKRISNELWQEVIKTRDTETTTTGVYTNSANSFSIINPLTTLPESWIGPSATTGIYFKGGLVGIGTITPNAPLTVKNPAAANVSSNSISLQDNTVNLTQERRIAWSSFGSDYPLGYIGTAFGSGLANSFMTFGTRIGDTVAERMRINLKGNVGIGLTVPTALLHLKAGTAIAETAPLKFTSGTLLATEEAGAIEFNTNTFYMTATNGVSGSTQRQAIPGVTTGTAAPATTPVRVGDIYVDTTNHKVYMSDGTTNSGNWLVLN